jgi:uridine kinase
MSQRQKLLEVIAQKIFALPSNRIQMVAIDGVDGAGKTVFANEVAALLESFGRPIIRASVDGFHNIREIRYRLGKDSPEGFYQDSYNYLELKNVLLNPLIQNRKYITAIFDVETNSTVEVVPKSANLHSILIFDGIFLHRPELREYWDFSIFLNVDFEVSIPRGAQRGAGSPDIYASSNKRYIEGQRIYLAQNCPSQYASLTIDNNDLFNPCIVKESH